MNPMPPDPDQGRFSVYSPRDHSAWLWIVTIFCVFLATSLLLFRIKDRLSTYSFDDFFATLTYAFVIVHSSLIMAALHDGLGKAASEINQTNLSKASKLVFTTRIVLWLVLGLSKCSILLTIRRMVDVRRESWICDAAIGFVCLWMIGAVCAINVGCIAKATLSRTSSCPGLDVRLIVVVAFDVLTELILFTIACYFFQGLQMPLGKKVQVLSGFFFRLGNIMLSICYLVLYLSFNEHGATNIGYIPVISVQQISVTYSLFSTIATSLARFANEFNTHGGSILELQQSRHEHYAFSSSQLPEAPSLRLDSRRSTMATPSKRLVNNDSKVLDDIFAIQCRPEYHNQSFDARRSRRQRSRNRPSDADSDDSTQGIVKKQDPGI